MTYKEFKGAADVVNRLRMMMGYVSRERFDMVAQLKFNITDDRLLDAMYGMVNSLPRLIWYVANDDNDDVRKPKVLQHLPKALEIVEAAYAVVKRDWRTNDVPIIECDRYRQADRRRYFYLEKTERRQVDISLGSRLAIILLAELMGREDVELIGVARHLGYLEGKVNGSSREKFDYYDGDIYFLYGDVFDNIFYSYISNGDDAGVYIATDDGWRKLLYTPTRGYLGKDGEPDFADEAHYSDYKLEGSGRAFRYIGNIHNDVSVLREAKKKEG